MYRLLRSRYIHRYIYVSVLYLSFCYNGFFAARGLLALMNFGSGLSAFFLAGVIPLIVYELFAYGVYKRTGRMFNLKGGDLKYDSRLFLIIANLAAGTIKLLYLAFPLFYTYGERLVAPVCYLLGLCWFLRHALLVYFARAAYSAAAGHIGSMNLSLIAFAVLVQMLLGVML